MTALILMMLWGTLSECQRHEFLVRILEMESKDPNNRMHRALVTTVKAALANEVPSDKILDKLLEVMEYGSDQEGGCGGEC